MPQRYATNFVCEQCKRNISIQVGDNKAYTSFKCDCRILILYPSGITSEIDKKKFQRGFKQ